MYSILETSIIDIIEKYARFFLSKNNVISIGLGNKFINTIDTKEPCLHVFVDKKVSLDKLKKHEIIPSQFLGIKTDVIKIGKYNRRNNSSSLNQISNDYFSFRKRPIEAGQSIGPYGIEWSGTLGGIVFDNYNENIAYILSNSHVLVNEKKIGKKVSILQPSAIDMGNYFNNIVAYLYNSVKLKFHIKYNKYIENYADCAIAKIPSYIDYKTEIYNIGAITGASKAKVNMKIRKVGKTTGYTEGVILSTNVINTSIVEENLYCTFAKQIMAKIESDEGDSGALVVDNNNKAIGLLNSGDEDNYAYISPIKYILESLNIHF